MSDESNKTYRRVQVIVSPSSYEELQRAIQTLKEAGQTDMSLSRFAKEALQKHFRETFGYDINLGADKWGGPRDYPSSHRK
jgi:hypothetical protein